MDEAEKWLSAPFRALVTAAQLIQSDDSALNSLMFLLEIQQFHVLKKSRITPEQARSLVQVFISANAPMKIEGISSDQEVFLKGQVTDGTDDDPVEKSQFLFEIFHNLQYSVDAVLIKRIHEIEASLSKGFTSSSTYNRERKNLTEVDHVKLHRIIEPALKYLVNVETNQSPGSQALTAAKVQRSNLILARMLNYLKCLSIPAHMLKEYEVRNRGSPRRQRSNAGAVMKMSHNFSNQVLESQREINNNRPRPSMRVKPQGYAIIEKIQSTFAKDSSWSETMPSKVVKGTGKSEVKRQEVIYELIKTEKSHANQMLVLKQLYMDPLKESGLVDDATIWTFFSNLDEIIMCTLMLCEKLLKKQEADYHVKTIGDIFDEEFEAFKSLSVFCANQVMAAEAIATMRKKDPEIEAFFKQCEKNPLSLRVTIDGLLVLPMQRLCRYSLILERIIKATPKTHKDYFNLVNAALPRIKEVLSFVDERVAVVTNTYKLKKLQSCLDTKDIKSEIDLCSVDRRTYVYEGELEVMTQRDTESLQKGKDKKKKADKMHVILLSDLLLLTYHKSSKITVAFEPIQLDKADSIWVKDNASGENKKSFILVFVQDKNPQMFELQAFSTSEKDRWIEVLNETIDKLQERENGNDIELIDNNKTHLAKSRSVSNVLTTTEDNVRPSSRWASDANFLENRHAIHARVRPNYDNLINELKRGGPS